MINYIPDIGLRDIEHLGKFDDAKHSRFVKPSNFLYLTPGKLGLSMLLAIPSSSISSSVNLILPWSPPIQIIKSIYRGTKSSMTTLMIERRRPHICEQHESSNLGSELFPAHTQIGNSSTVRFNRGPKKPGRLSTPEFSFPRQKVSWESGYLFHEEIVSEPIEGVK